MVHLILLLPLVQVIVNKLLTPALPAGRFQILFVINLQPALRAVTLILLPTSVNPPPLIPVLRALLTTAV